MAKNIGIIKFTGKVGGLCGRDTAFGNIIQTPGGFKGERIKTEARYEKTRQLYTEFGRCATLSSLFKRSLDPYLKLLPDPYVYNHIQKRMAAIKECDTASPKGEKTVGKGLLTEAGISLLKSFSFNRKRHFGFAALSFYSLDMEHGRLALEHVDAARFKFPAGANAVGMQLIVMRVDFEAAECVMVCSDYSFLRKEENDVAMVLDAGIPDGDGIVIWILFVGFCGLKDEEVVWKRVLGNALEVIRLI